MTCPICDQKPMNCDCTETERRQFSEIEELRLTDAEREAVERAAEIVEELAHPETSVTAATLRELLERTQTNRIG